MKAAAEKPAFPDYDRRKNPNSQPVLMGGVQVPFQRTENLRWVRRGAKYVLQQQWSRTVTHATLALKKAHGRDDPTVAQVWMDVPEGEE